MTTPLIYQQIPKIMAEVGHIAKARENVAQRYKFRGIDDVYQALQGVLAKHQVFTTSEVLAERTEVKESKGGSSLIYRVITFRWRFYAADGSFVITENIGEGMDSGDKASNKAMSVAHKYALLQVFAIPTEEAKDPEHDSHEVKFALHPHSLFYIKDPDHRRWLKAEFDKLGIDPSFREEIANTLHGKNYSELGRVVSEVTSR